MIESGGMKRRRGVDQLLDVGLDEGLRLHRGEHLGAVDRFAVVRDAAGAAGQVGGQLGVAGRDHGPAVDEDLRADLLGDDLAVQGDRAARGAGMPCLRRR